MDVSKQKIISAFDELAKDYDHNRKGQFAKGCYPYVLNTLIPIQFKNLLDIGCGTGNLIYRLLDEKPKVKVYGLDVSDEMLKKAKDKLPKNIEVVYGEAEALPYDNKKFELVIMVNSFNYFINPGQAVKEAYRVLKPGGKLIIADSMVSGIKKIFVDGNNYSEAEVRSFFAQAGFDMINLVHNIPDGYVATGDKR